MKPYTIAALISVSFAAMTHMAASCLDEQHSGQVEKLYTRMTVGSGESSFSSVLGGASRTLNDAQISGLALETENPQLGAVYHRATERQPTVEQGSLSKVHVASDTSTPVRATAVSFAEKARTVPTPHASVQGEPSSTPPPKRPLPDPSTYKLLTVDGIEAYKADRGLAILRGDNAYRRERHRQLNALDPLLKEQRIARARELATKKRGFDKDGKPFPLDYEQPPTRTGVTAHPGQFTSPREYSAAYKAQRRQDPDFKVKERKQQRQYRERRKAKAKLALEQGQAETLLHDTSLSDSMDTANTAVNVGGSSSAEIRAVSSKDKAVSIDPIEQQKGKSRKLKAPPQTQGQSSSGSAFHTAATALVSIHRPPPDSTSHQPLVQPGIPQELPSSAPDAHLAPTSPRSVRTVQEYLDLAKQILLDGSP